MRILILTVWLLGASISGAALYAIAYEVERMESELAALEMEIRDEREATHGLKAEWAYLARPARIEELSRTYLPRLRNLSVSQIGLVDEVPYQQLPDVLDVLEPPDQPTPAAAEVTR